MTPEVDEQGYFVLTNHTLVTLRFKSVAEVEMEGFDTQNVLWGLSIRDITDRQIEGLRFEVSFDASVGLSLGFECAAIRVASADPCSDNPREGDRIQSLPKAGQFEEREARTTDCLCGDLHELLYFDERPNGFRTPLVEVASGEWAKLYRCRSCGQLWRIDNSDKYSARFATKIPSAVGWDGYDTIALEKALLLESRGERPQRNVRGPAALTVISGELPGAWTTSTRGASGSKSPASR
jgi:hypothetical protein